MTGRSLKAWPQAPDNLVCLAVKQVFETYVYAQTLSIAKHAPFVHAALSTAHAQAHDANKSVSESLVKDGGVAGTILTLPLK
ncbi:hypothetical protein EGU77_28345, partial [Pseudomonas syringae pv. theae]|nr:hypothetical protein [Pseudomonas syringae pv. theae]